MTIKTAFASPFTAILTTLFAVAISVGCDSAPPAQPLNFANGILNMSISQDWVLQRDAGKRAYFKHNMIDGVKLSFENQTADFGAPMSVGAVRGAIGSELNLRYGGVEAKLGYGGCAILS
jgi:hypothetical protein